jgi:hypothetical protein
MAWVRAGGELLLAIGLHDCWTRQVLGRKIPPKNNHLARTREPKYSFYGAISSYIELKYTDIGAIVKRAESGKNRKTYAVLIANPVSARASRMEPG